MALEFSGKSVLIVDGEWEAMLAVVVSDPWWADSIVRGTTSKEIIQMAKDRGARKVIFASCAPPIRYAGLLARPPHIFMTVLFLDIPTCTVSTCLRVTS